MKVFICTLLILMLSLPTVALSSVCLPQRQPQRIYSAPPVQKQIVDRVIILQKIIEFDPHYFFGLNGYFSTIQNLNRQHHNQNQEIIQKQSEQIDKLIELLKRAIDNKGDYNPQPLPPQPSPQPQPQPQPQPTPQPPQPAPGNDLNTIVYNIFRKNCYNCHGPRIKRGGLQLIGEDENGNKWLNDLSLEDRILVYDLTLGVNLVERGKQRMPLGGPPLTQEEVEYIRLWMIEKAEQQKGK